MFPRVLAWTIDISCARKTVGGRVWVWTSGVQFGTCWVWDACYRRVSRCRQSQKFRRKVQSGERNQEATLIPKTFWSQDFLMPPLVSFSVFLSFFFFPSIFSSHLPPLNNNLYCLVLTCLHLSEIPNAQMHRKQHIFILHERNWFSLTLAQLFESLKNGTPTTSNKPIMFSAQPTAPNQGNHNCNLMCEELTVWRIVFSHLGRELRSLVPPKER